MCRKKLPRLSKLADLDFDDEHDANDWTNDSGFSDVFEDAEEKTWEIIVNEPAGGLRSRGVRAKFKV